MSPTPMPRKSLDPSEIYLVSIIDVLQAFGAPSGHKIMSFASIVSIGLALASMMNARNVTNTKFNDTVDMI